MKKLNIIILIVFLTLETLAQTNNTDIFYDQLPYTDMISITHDNHQKIYTASSYGVMIYDTEEKSVSRLSKVEGLSDIGIKWIEYSIPYQALIIVYENANIDIVKDHDIVNISDIKRKTILGEKTIHSIFLKDKYAYLSCGFGIVVLDLEREEIYDTYKIGPQGSLIQVFDLTYHPEEKKFYAATELGICAASAENTNLAHFENWHFENSANFSLNGVFNQIEYFKQSIVANKHKEAYNADTLYMMKNNTWDTLTTNNNHHVWVNSIKGFNDRLLISYEYGLKVYDTTLNLKYVFYTYGDMGKPHPHDAIFLNRFYWIADRKLGLIKFKQNNVAEQIKTSGPDFPTSFNMDTFEDQVWVVSGGRNHKTWSGIFLNHGFYSFVDSEWTSYNSRNTEQLEGISDFICVAIEPNLGKKKYIGTWTRGLIEMENNEIVNIYNETNSSLQINPASGSGNWVQISGMAYDKDGNLWVVNTGTGRPLSVLKTNGEWRSFDLGSQASNEFLGEIIIDDENQKWILMRNNKIIVFSDNNTLDNPADDNVRVLNKNPDNGALPGSSVRSIANDMDGNIWIGTDQGVAVIYNPEDVLTGVDINAEKPKVEVGDFVQYLLREETVTVIKVDGDNNKWFGTERAGIFLMSPDGTEQLRNFNMSNSPLFSNEITAVGINSLGFVFIGTRNGIISYKGTASKGAQSNSNVFIYPNPVRDNYKGPISITNLVKDSNVKITDISGDLVYEDMAKGGQVVWDGLNFDGEKVKPGYYLVFITDTEDGEDTKVGKILILR